MNLNSQFSGFTIKYNKVSSYFFCTDSDLCCDCIALKCSVPILLCKNVQNWTCSAPLNFLWQYNLICPDSDLWNNSAMKWHSLWYDLSYWRSAFCSTIVIVQPVTFETLAEWSSYHILWFVLQLTTVFHQGISCPNYCRTCLQTGLILQVIVISHPLCHILV